MHRKKSKGNKKNSAKSKVNKAKTELKVAQVFKIVEYEGTQMENVETKHENDKVLEKAPLNKKLSSSSKRSKKRKRTLVSDPNAYQCTVCGMGYKTVFTLKRHLEYYGDPIYPCEECGTKFTDEKQLEHHITQAHLLSNLKKYKYQCPICSQLVMMKDHLRCHMFHYHKGWEDVYPNLFGSESETRKIATSAVIKKCVIKVEDDQKDTSEGQSQTGVGGNIKDCTARPEINDTNNSSTIPLEKNSCSMITLENNSSVTISLENDISETIRQEQNSSLTKELDNKITEIKAPDNDNSEIKALENKITETNAPETDNSEIKALKKKITETNAPGIDNSEIKTLENKITETTTPEIDHSETKVLENKLTEINTPENDITETKALENKITETKTLENDITETKALENKITETKTLENDITETKALENKITETNILENDITEMKALENTVTETKATEINITGTKAPEINITEAKAPEVNITETKTLENKIAETTAPEIDITETKAPEINITQTKTSEINITETKAPEINITETKVLENNTTETKASKTPASASPIDFPNLTEDEKQKDTSWVDDQTVSPNDENTPLQNISMKPDLPINDTSPSSFVKLHVELNEVETLLNDATTAVEETDKNRKSFNSPQHPENDETFQKNPSTENNADNDVLLIAKESNNDETAEDNDIMIENEREAKLKTLHSCKDCYIPLPRLNIKSKRVRVRIQPRHAGLRPSYLLFPRRPKDSTPVIDFSKENPNDRNIVRTLSAPVPCTLCDEIFENETGRRMHIELRHTFIPSIICDKKFATRQAMFRHYRQRHFVSNENKTYCVCGMELVGQTAIHRHFYQYAGEVTHTTKLPATTYNVCKPLPTNYDCEKCGAKFWLNSCMKYHESLKCGSTKKVEPNRPQRVRRRYKRPAEDDVLHYCKVCEKAFHSKVQLTKHETVFSRPGTHPCSVCGTIFRGHRQLASHVHATHERDPTKYYPYHCRFCNQGFTQVSFEYVHRMHFHQDKLVEEESSDSELDELSMTDSDVSDDETTKKCNVCELEFSSGKRFINHLIYYSKEEIIECNICLEEFEGQYKAHRHNKLVHYSTDSQIAFTHHCTICEEGFMWKTLLQAHLCHVHGIAAIKAQYITNRSQSIRSNNEKVDFRNIIDTCKICDISFPSPVLLAAHEIENMNEGKFICNKCSRRCRTASILLDHLSLNHSNTAIQDGVKCRRCNENFQTRWAWVSHVKHFHFTEEPSEFYFEKNVTCSEKLGNSLRYELTVPTNRSIISGLASFRIKSSLAETSYLRAVMEHIHENADTRSFIKLEEPNSTNDPSNNVEVDGPETPWKCTICSLSCRGPAEFAKHTALYSDNGHYMCELCGRRFAWLSIWQEHKKKHYRNESDKFFCPTCNEGFETLRCKISHEAHLHKKSPEEDQTANTNVSSTQPSNSSNNPRSLLRPKLPSIVSFFQSDSANEPQANRHMLSLSEKKGEENYEGSYSPRLHTEIFEDELSMTYQCPDCQEKYPTLEQLHEHLTAVHKMKQDPTEDLPDRLNGFLDSVNCEICDMNFASKNLLSIHQKSIHSLSSIEITRINSTPVSAVKLPSQKRPCFNNDHTYTSGKKKKASHVTKSPTWNTSAVEATTVKIKSEYPPSASSSNREIPATASLPLSQTNSEKPQPRREVSSMIVKREYVSSTSNNVQTKIASQFRCNVCPITFVDKNVLRAHELNVHCLMIDGNQPSDNSSMEESSGSSKNAMEQLNRLVGNLPTAPENVNATAISADFETIMIPVTTYDFNISVPESAKSIETLKPIDPSSNANVDNLPPGNYKVSQLKVRPFAKIVQKLQKQAVQKPRKKEPQETTELAAKRSKHVFDAIAFRELCRQHNLVPPVYVKPMPTIYRNFKASSSSSDSDSENPTYSRYSSR